MPDAVSDVTGAAGPVRLVAGAGAGSWGGADHVPIALVLVDDIGNVVDFNLAAARLLGGPPHGLLKRGAPFLRVLAGASPQFVAWRTEGRTEPLAVKIRCRTRLARAHLQRTSGPSGRTVISVITDPAGVTHDAHRLAFEMSEVGTFVARADGTIIDLNPALVGLVLRDTDDVDLDTERAAILGSDWRDLLLRRGSPVERATVNRELNLERGWKGLVTITTTHGRERILEASITLRPVEEESSRAEAGARSVIGYVVDVTEQTSTEQMLHAQARRDALTGLYNRTGFLEELHRRFDDAQRNGGELTFLFTDLDNFKSVNDHYGHRYGDLLLMAFAKRLRAALKSSDVVGRIGGDEFVVLFDPGVKRIVLDNVIAKLRHRLCDDYQLDDLTYTCTASFGSAEYPWDASTADELLEFADHAMYQAKSAGRNRHARFDRLSFRGWVDREELRESIEAGIGKLEFVPFYQPLFDTHTGRVVGAEALARWLHPDGSIRHPAEFMGVMEAGSAIITLGVRMFDQVLIHMKAWESTVGPIEVSVNLSAAQLRSEDVIAHLEHLAERYPRQIRRLHIEVVESAFYDGDPIISDNLARLSKLGVSLSLDDFGTGHSSLLSLRAHDFRQVKIDRQFLLAADRGDSADRLVLESMISLNRGLGLQTVCEGVETDAQLSYLRELGCDLVQGFLLGRPMPKEEFRALLRDEYGA